MVGRLGGALALVVLVLAGARASEVPMAAVRAQADPDGKRPGAMLRAVDRAVAAGAFEDADGWLKELAARHPVVADYADLERLRLLRRMDRRPEALALAEAWPHSESPLRGEVHREVAEARVARGDESAARMAYEEALAATQGSDDRAALLFALGASLRRSGQYEEAGRRWTEIWVNYPLADLPGARRFSRLRRGETRSNASHRGTHPRAGRRTLQRPLQRASPRRIRTFARTRPRRFGGPPRETATSPHALPHASLPRSDRGLRRAAEDRGEPHRESTRSRPLWRRVRRSRRTRGDRPRGRRRGRARTRSW